jgi:hypothetical protein
MRGMACEVENIIWMIWRNEQEQSFKVGELCRIGEKYYFKYDAEGVRKAEEYGFYPLPQFPRLDVEYFREELFNSFSQRLPCKREANNALKEYKLKEYDLFELLKRSGGKTTTDSLEFVPHLNEESIILDSK